MKEMTGDTRLNACQEKARIKIRVIALETGQDLESLRRRKRENYMKGLISHGRLISMQFTVRGQNRTEMSSINPIYQSNNNKRSIEDDDDTEPIQN
jgi:hypothetical protein